MHGDKRRGRRAVAAGCAVLLGLGVVIGLIFENVWLGVALAVLVSIGWIIAAESWRGGNAGLDDPDRGVEL